MDARINLIVEHDQVNRYAIHDTTKHVHRCNVRVIYQELLDYYAAYKLSLKMLTETFTYY